LLNFSLSQTDPLQWRIIFFISAGVYFFGNLQFIIFGKASIQPWNDPEAERKRSKSQSSNPRMLLNGFFYQLSDDGAENPAMEY